ncbi:hypothetical protein [Brevundimonas sp. Root1423]|uniref:hypothetical protein n=1 Tax=Brevundimonas sp. Root1423 TaxID=1736462 RepID=UPI0012E35CB3|nr:hypothetical protein [Brevundimonas sp. Root1423]
MAESQTRPVFMYHSSCLQDDISAVPPGAGAFAVVLSNELRIHSPFDSEQISLPAGTPLLGHAQVDSLADEVERHLRGSIMGSDLRLGVMLLLGHEPDAGRSSHPDAVVTGAVDHWLGENTAFIFWPRTGSVTGLTEDGLFAGMVRSLLP